MEDQSPDKPDTPPRERACAYCGTTRASPSGRSCANCGAPRTFGAIRVLAPKVVSERRAIALEPTILHR